MECYFFTRDTGLDYQQVGWFPSLPNGADMHWRRFGEFSAAAYPQVILESRAGYWQLYVTAIDSGRLDYMDRVIRISFYITGTSEDDTKSVFNFLQTYISTTLGEKEGKRFLTDTLKEFWQKNMPAQWADSTEAEKKEHATNLWKEVTNPTTSESWNDATPTSWYAGSNRHRKEFIERCGRLLCEKQDGMALSLSNIVQDNVLEVFALENMPESTAILLTASGEQDCVLTEYKKPVPVSKPVSPPQPIPKLEQTPKLEPNQTKNVPVSKVRKALRFVRMYPTRITIIMVTILVLLSLSFIPLLNKGEKKIIPVQKPVPQEPKSVVTKPGEPKTDVPSDLPPAQGSNTGKGEQAGKTDGEPSTEHNALGDDKTSPVQTNLEGTPVEPIDEPATDGTVPPVVVPMPSGVPGKPISDKVPVATDSSDPIPEDAPNTVQEEQAKPKEPTMKPVDLTQDSRTEGKTPPLVDFTQGDGTPIP